MKFNYRKYIAYVFYGIGIALTNTYFNRIVTEDDKGMLLLLIVICLFFGCGLLSIDKRIP
jgi:hypothetical protein